MFGHEQFFFARSDEVFPNGSRVMNPAHCLTRGNVAFFWRQTGEAAEME